MKKEYTVSEFAKKLAKDKKKRTERHISDCCLRLSRGEDVQLLEGYKCRRKNGDKGPWIIYEIEEQEEPAELIEEDDEGNLHYITLPHKNVPLPAHDLEPHEVTEHFRKKGKQHLLAQFKSDDMDAAKVLWLWMKDWINVQRIVSGDCTPVRNHNWESALKSKGILRKTEKGNVEKEPTEIRSGHLLLKAIATAAQSATSNDNDTTLRIHFRKNGTWSLKFEDPCKNPYVWAEVAGSDIFFDFIETWLLEMRLPFDELPPSIGYCFQCGKRIPTGAEFCHSKTHKRKHKEWIAELRGLKSYDEIGERLVDRLKLVCKTLLKERRVLHIVP